MQEVLAMTEWDGHPENPERTAYHWVQLSGGGIHAAYWNKVEWNLGRDYLRPCEAAYSWRYIGPCLTPAEVEATVQAALAARPLEQL